MKWEEKHDTILNWIYSCKTKDQLDNMVLFAKKQTFDNSDLLFFASVKEKQLKAHEIVESMEKMISDGKRILGVR